MIGINLKGKLYMQLVHMASFRNDEVKTAQRMATEHVSNKKICETLTWTFNQRWREQNVDKNANPSFNFIPLESYKYKQAAANACIKRMRHFSNAKDTKEYDVGRKLCQMIQ